MNYIDQKVFKAEIEHSFGEIIDPTGTVNDADPASRDRYYFFEGMIAAMTLLKDEEFDFDKFKHEPESNCFGDAMSIFRSSLRTGDTITKRNLAEKIKTTLEMI